MRRLASLLATCCLLLAAPGCSSLQGTGDKGYIAGNGQITVLDPADRGDPVELEGTSLDGAPLSLADLRGQVAVVNVWGAWCADCRAEMPDLVAATAEVADDVAFLGIDVRDPSVEPARSFVRSFGVPYPSIYDPDGRALLAFSGTLSPRTIPSTLVLDREGRIAASILGPIPSTQTLTDLVEEIAAGSSQAPPDG